MSYSDPSRPRFVRPTLRCLRDDLQVPLPPAVIDLGELDHPILAKARELAQSYPQAQDRIWSIEDVAVYRFTHGRYRVVTWLDDDTNIVWVCAADLRDDATYEYFRRLHERGELLPGEEGEEDAERRERERAYQFDAAVRAGVSEWLRDARTHSGEVRPFVLPGGAEILLYIAGNQGSEEIWLAMPKANAPEPVIGLLPRQRTYIVTAIEHEVGEFDAEQRRDWPLGPLHYYELAYLIVT